MVGSPQGGRNVTRLEQLRGDCEDIASATTGQGLVKRANGKWGPEDVGGGSGIPIAGTPGDGDMLVYDASNTTYRPRPSGVPVYSVTDPITYTPPGGGSARMVRAARTNKQTTATINVGSNPNSASLASADGFAVGYGIYFPGAGAAHGLSVPGAPSVSTRGTAGATSRDYRLRVLSGDGGWTDCGTITTLTTGNATLSTTDYDIMFWAQVSGARAYAVYGVDTTDANHYLLAIVHGQPTALAIQFDAAGYTNAIDSDIGKTVVQGTHDGVLLGFDNTARIWWVDPTVWNTDTFNGSGAAVTITTGTGAGTQTSAATNAIYWANYGAAAAAVRFKHLGRRNSAETYIGELMLYPLSTSGNFYRCVRTMEDKTTASSPPTFNTTLGGETTDGNVVWRRVDECVPIAATAGAANNALTTHITELSGTTATLADAATASVTGGRAMHDDLGAVQAWNAKLVASGAVSAVLSFVGCHDIDVRPGTPLDDGVGNDARWNVTANGANDYLFSLFKLSHSSKSSLEIEWWAHGATIWHAWTDTPSRLVDDSANAALTDVRHCIEINGSAFTMRGGRYIYAPSGATPMEHGDAWNWVFFTAGAITARAPHFYVVSLLAWPRLTNHGDEYSAEQGEVWDGCYATYGGAGHDGAWYTPGGWWNKTVCEGIRFDRSLGIYHDDNTFETSLWINGCTFKKFLQNGIRIRMGSFYFTMNQCFDFENLIDSGGNEGFFAHNRFERCAITLDSLSRLHFVNNTVIDGTISLTAASLYCNFNKFELTASYAPSTTTTLVQLAGASVCGEYIGNQLDLTAYTPGTSVRDWLLQGSGNWKVCKNAHRSESVFTFRSTCTGTVLYEGNDVSTTFTGPSPITPCAGNGSYIFRDNIWTGGSASQPMLIQAGTRVVMDNDRLVTCNLSVAAISGTFEMRNCKLPSATASVFAKTGSVLVDNEFAVAPTLTGMTGLRRRGNTIAGSRVQTVTALAANTNNLLVGICDILLLTTNGTNNYDLTGLAGLAEGEIVQLLNGEASGSDVITFKHRVTSSAGNQLSLAGGVDYGADPGDSLTVQVLTAGGATYYREIGRSAA